MEFSGAKVAVFLGSQLLVIRRDMKPDIPFPGYWDLPGGGRENGETPQECALRETYEEVGLVLQEEEFVWSAISQRPEGVSWFFVAHLPVGRTRDIRFGNEGHASRRLLPRCDGDSAFCRASVNLSGIGWARCGLMFKFAGP